MNKIEAILKSNTAKQIVATAGAAVINITVGLVIAGVCKGGAALIGVAADAVRKNAESV